MGGSPDCLTAPGATRDHAGALGAVAAGRSAPLGATVCGGGGQLQRVRQTRRADRAAALRRGRCRNARARDPARRRAAPHLSLLARVRAGPPAGTALRISRARTVRARRGLRFDRTKVLLDPYGRALAVPSRYNRAAASGPGDNAASAMKSVVANPEGYDWEGDVVIRRPFAETIIYELHVAGFTRHPSSGVAAGKRGTYGGIDREDPVPPGPWRDRGRTDAGVSVRSTPRAERRELLGLSADLVLCAASRVQFAGRSAGGARRVPRHGQGVPPRANRGDPRRGLQSHRGRGSGRPDALLSRPGERCLLHPREGPLTLCRLHGLRQHAERQPVDCAAPDPRQPALLGDRDAHRRLPVRPGVDSVA